MANEMSISNFLTRDDVSKKIKDVVGPDGSITTASASCSASTAPQSQIK